MVFTYQSWTEYMNEAGYSWLCAAGMFGTFDWLNMHLEYCIAWDADFGYLIDEQKHGDSGSRCCVFFVGHCHYAGATPSEYTIGFSDKDYPGSKSGGLCQLICMEYHLYIDASIPAYGMRLILHTFIYFCTPVRMCSAHGPPRDCTIGQWMTIWSSRSHKRHQLMGLKRWTGTSPVDDPLGLWFVVLVADWRVSPAQDWSLIEGYDFSNSDFCWLSNLWFSQAFFNSKKLLLIYEFPLFCLAACSKNPWEELLGPF